MDAARTAKDLLEMYESRLKFIDIYDQLLAKIEEQLLLASQEQPAPSLSFSEPCIGVY